MQDQRQAGSIPLIEMKCEALMLLFGFLLLFGFPVSFLLFDLKNSTEDLILHSVGIAFSLSLMRYSLLRYKTATDFMRGIKDKAVLLSGIAGLFLLYAVIGNMRSYLPCILGLLTWGATGYLVELLLKRFKPASRIPKTPPDMTYDTETVFDPEKSTAHVLYELIDVKYGVRLPELLFNKGIAVKLLTNTYAHIRHLEIYRGNDWAFVCILCRDITQSAGSRELHYSECWDISVAVHSQSEAFIQDIEDALNQVTRLGEGTKRPAIKKIPMQRLQALSYLVSFEKAIRSSRNLNVVSLKFIDGWLEVQIRALFSGSNIIHCTQTLTLSMSHFGYLQADDFGVNEDVTVATEDVPLFDIPLPFESCKLTNMWILDTERKQEAAILYLVFSELVDGKTNFNQAVKIIVLQKDDVIHVNDNLALSGRFIPVTDFIYKQAVIIERNHENTPAIPGYRASIVDMPADSSES